MSRWRKEKKKRKIVEARAQKAVEDATTRRDEVVESSSG